MKSIQLEESKVTEPVGAPPAVSLPTPHSVFETGLPGPLLRGLLLKHLLKREVASIKLLAELMGLSGNVIAELVAEAKANSLVENRNSEQGQMRVALSAAGRQQARQALELSGYVGKAPVPLEEYRRICIQQSSRRQAVGRQRLLEVFDTTVVQPDLIDQIGPAINSRRAVLIYGAAGTGKSFICRQLNRLFGDEVMIPHAVEMGGEIVQIFDPQIHQRIDSTFRDDDLFAQVSDPRWYRCHRPLVVVGGELELSMLDISHDPKARLHKAPIGLLANNGVLLIDDLGRQKISAKEVFNRWIVPLEEARDFLSLPSGAHFEVPFEQNLLFSTNLSPQDIFDPAFLRRLGYKIEFKAIDDEAFVAIWQQQCRVMGLNDKHHLGRWLVQQCYPTNQLDMLPSHPRDLLSIVSDQIRFNGLSSIIEPELLERAWNIYFVEASRCPFPAAVATFNEEGGSL
ncbi:AAA family ATPase [Marinobacter salinisoli]|uniref:AAA family ATPase n=1 Tax=Marinobacter salinisoli TaxID=2769486 RepID=A0ABX7MRI1_9GAMM|nr:AAA family ATPase [Marinobacter salinisoli]QSP94971.1 AAA family ATPase [Marinobacter salinisoli]